MKWWKTSPPDGDWLEVKSHDSNTNYFRRKTDNSQILIDVAELMIGRFSDGELWIEFLAEKKPA